MVRNASVSRKSNGDTQLPAKRNFFKRYRVDERLSAAKGGWIYGYNTGQAYKISSCTIWAGSSVGHYAATFGQHLSEHFGCLFFMGHMCTVEKMLDMCTSTLAGGQAFGHRMEC